MKIDFRAGLSRQVSYVSLSARTREFGCWAAGDVVDVMGF